MTGAPLTPERWAAVEALFDRVVSIEPADRDRVLATETDGDPALRREVESLLAAHDDDPAFLEAPPPWLASPAADDPPAELPERIGEYRILELLGRGGMGQVYLAEREAHEFRQRVALKVMRRGLDTDDLLRRFRAERQILATLDHPNIARLLDVGATPDGLPYFVMEHVEGRTLLAHCRDRGLSVRHRLALFRTVCGAVHHAHQSLVVHRDIKPGNILVTDAGVPKLLDFGIAKIVDPAQDAAGHTTVAGQRLLTPGYSAPEQIRGDAITTACDVWALGVLLYELLAARHPFADPDGGRAADLTRAILEDTPPAPAAVAPEPLRRALAGDLDTIVLKALRKEPGERYPSVLSFSDDVRRHVEGLPVEARPATLRYRARTFVRRNRGAVAAGIGLFLLLTGFSSVTAWQSARIRTEARHVTAERDKALQVRTFLLETFGTTGPGQPGGDTVAVRELLDRRAATIDEAFSADPALRAEMTGVLAEAYDQLGLHRQAEPLARRALELKRALYGDEHPDIVAALNLLGWIIRETGDLDAAETHLRQAVDLGRATFPPDGDARLARALNDLGVVREAQGQYDEAAALYRESLDMRRRVLGEGHVGVAVTTNNLAVNHYRQGDLEQAAAMAAEAVEAFRAALGDDHQRTLVALGNLASLHGLQEDHQGAAEAYGRILERHRRVLGPRHHQTAYALTMRASHLGLLNRDADAEPLAREALEIQLETLGPRHERVVQTLRVLGDAEHGLGRPADALARYLEALEIVRSIVGEEHREVAVLRVRAARARAALGRPADAEADFREAIRVFTVALEPGHYLTADATLGYAEFLIAQRRYDEATPLADRIAPVLDSLGPSFEKLRVRLANARGTIDASGH